MEKDELNGYALGADNYVTKPFSLPVLYAKAMAVMGRIRGNDPLNHINRGNIRIVSIPEENLPHVFHMFYTGDKSRNSKEKHLGLGLYLAKKIFTFFLLFSKNFILSYFDTILYGEYNKNKI